MRQAMIDARERAGLTQEQLADIVGVDRTYINLIENNRRTPSLPKALAIARALGTTVDAIFLPTDVTKGHNQQAAAAGQ